MKRLLAAVASLVLLVAAVFGIRAAVFAARRAHQLRPRDIPVLMYHNVLDEVGPTSWQVSAEEFARQMDQLAEAGYSTVLPHDIERATRGRGWFPRKPVVITFDDGYEGVKTFAEPILAKHGFRAICYVIVNRLGGEGPDRAEFDSGPLLSTNEVAEMAARGTVAIGIHSLTHVPIPHRLEKEILRGRQRLLDVTGVTTRDYCFPFGLYRYDFMDAALRRSGYATAMICEDRMFRYGAETNLLAIPRLSVYGGPHAISVAATNPEDGTVALANDGVKIPLRAVVRRKADGHAWSSSLEWVGEGMSPTYRFPREAFAAPYRIEAWDKAGLFRYL